MTIFGNICLLIASVAYLLLVNSFYNKDFAHNSDGAMEYSVTVAICNLFFWVCITIATVIIAWSNGFEWVAASPVGRNVWVTVGLLAAIIVTFLLTLSRDEPVDLPVFFRVLLGFLPAMIPLVFVVAGFILLNNDLRETVPVAFYKIPLAVVSGLNILAVAAGLIGLVVVSRQNAAQSYDSAVADEDRYHQDHLNNIDTCDVAKNIVHILCFTSQYHAADVRERAIAKIKTNPEWQQELVRLLENDGAVEAFTFLASNEVDDKNLFAGPIDTGILSIATWIRREIQPYNAYPEQFYPEIERMLLTADRFKGMGTDYRPAVQTVQAIFSELSREDKAKYNGAALLDNWVKRNQ